MSTIDKIKALKWFHAIDFGEFASSGRFEPGKPQNITLFGVFEFLQHLDLSKARLLDLGSYDGLIAFGSKKLGAKSVVAVDTFDHSTFRLGRSLLGFTDQDIYYRPGYQIKDLSDIFEQKEFDVVVCAGIFYHMLHPMQSFTECRKVLGDGGYLIIETPFEANRNDAVLLFNGVEKVINEPYTYFVPTKAALTGMANLSGFNVIATRTLAGPKRITLLLQAVDRKVLVENPTVAEFTKQMLKRDLCDDSFRFSNIEKTFRNSPRMEGKLNELEIERNINISSHVVTFPFHPPENRPLYGKTRFETAKGNTKTL